jgi:hypothetical protein
MNQNSNPNSNSKSKNNGINHNSVNDPTQNSDILSKINQNMNNSFYSLHNITNYKKIPEYSTNELLEKHNALMIEYLHFVSENINIKGDIFNKFIIIRGLETVYHVFNIILHYSKNLDLAFYHGQKAFYFYVEFISQIMNDKNIFLQLNTRDASIFVYKKTIFNINEEYRKNMCIEQNIFHVNQFHILNNHTHIIKNLFSIFINNLDLSVVNQKKEILNMIVIKIELLLKKMNNQKLNKLSFDGVLYFVECLNINFEPNISIDKYYTILDLFINKIKKIKLTDEILVNLKMIINNYINKEKINNTNPDVFTSLLFSTFI